MCWHAGIRISRKERSFWYIPLRLSLSFDSDLTPLRISPFQIIAFMRRKPFRLRHRTINTMELSIHTCMLLCHRYDFRNSRNAHEISKFERQRIVNDTNKALLQCANTNLVTTAPPEQHKLRYYLCGGGVNHITNLSSFRRGSTLIMGNAYYGKDWRKPPAEEGGGKLLLELPDVRAV